MRLFLALELPTCEVDRGAGMFLGGVDATCCETP